MIIGSDGTSDNAMSVGWVISKDDSTRLIECEGPTYYFLASFRAEGYGVKYPYDYLYNTLESDWDIIAQTVGIIQLISMYIYIKNVKGYQDNNNPYTELNVPAKMNVNADRLAGNYRETNEVQLNTEKGTMASHDFEHIHKRSTRRELCKCTHERY
eukprot:8593800-Ditylum_brightwellii.AAC.1